MSLDPSRTLLSIFLNRVQENPQRDALISIQGAKTVTTSWTGWESRSRLWASSLIELGVRAGDRVAVFANSRVEWCWFDMAALMVGAITVPGFCNDPPRRSAGTIEHSGAEFLLVENPGVLKRLLQQPEGLKGLRHVLVLKAEATGPDGELIQLSDLPDDVIEARLWGLEAFQDLGEAAMETHAPEIERRMETVQPADLATIAYTPGTEGRSKGVVLSHQNFVHAADAIAQALPIGPDDTQLLYLPLAHVFGRICVWTTVLSGGTLAFAQSYAHFDEDARTIEPTFFCTVPRLFEKLHAELTRAEASQGDLQRLVTRWAQDGEEGGFLSGLRRKVADTLVYARIRERFGPNLRFAVSGGAPLRAEVGRFLDANGLCILEGYGLAETTAAGCLNRIDSNRYGTVGTALKGIELKLAEDGEVLLRGANISPGYWIPDEPLRAAVDAEGWLHTGDVGRVDEDGFVSIIDRKRNIILTAHGKVVAPVPIAEALRMEPLIDQAIIYGEGKPFLTALITLDAEGLMQFGLDSGLEATPEELTRHDVVYAAIEARLAVVNRTLPAHEQIQKFAILTSPLTEEEGELTPTRLVRRRMIIEKHRALLESFYSERY